MQNYRASAKTTPRSVKEIYQRASALVPKLAERARHCEEMRRCPPETIADFAEAGLLDLCKPARYGGMELDWEVVCEVGRILAHGCASQAWVCTVLNGHNQMLGTLSAEAQEEILGQERNARFAASMGPVGKARLVDDGAVLSGRFPFASGIDYADWLICGAMLEKDNARPTYFEFLIPASSARVIDDWYAAGLAGSGSKTFEVDEVFVPPHRFQDHIYSEDGTGPGTLINHAPVFRTPRTTVAVHCFSAISVGIAEAFLETYIAHTGQRKGRSNSEAGSNHTGLALESARIESLASYQAKCLAEWTKRVGSATVLEAHEKQRARFQACWIARQSLQAVQSLFASAGAHAILDSSILQRQVRDLMAVVAHRGLFLEEAAPAYTKSILARGMV